ncbi:MAG: NAD/NADP octopine/nopaline dehydrogenase family protein [Actinomycetota bacterium]|nr:NAD/NADP octopine/nopaline dehydrogenase family protein [Actinomycetota bacterium]
MRPDVTFLEVGTLPYLARLTAPDKVGIPVAASRLPVGSIPGDGPRADAAHETFATVNPSAVRVADGLDAALTNWGLVIHPPLITHNLGATESLGDRFDIHSEGTSPAVKRAILALDAERIALREILGIPAEHWPISTHYERSPLGMYPPDAHDRLVATGLWRESLDLEHRYLWEDTMCGLVLSASLGRLAGFAMPQSEAILQLVGVALGVDPWTIGRTTASIGIADLGEARRLAASGLA